MSNRLVKTSHPPAESAGHRGCELFSSVLHRLRLSAAPGEPSAVFKRLLNAAASHSLERSVDSTYSVTNSAELCFYNIVMHVCRPEKNDHTTEDMSAFCCRHERRFRYRV